MFKNILVPTDGSSLSRATVEKAVDFAREVGARLTFFTAVHEAPFAITDFSEGGHYDPDKPKRFAEAALKHAREILDAALQVAGEAGVEADSVVGESDAPWQAIIGAAEARGVDLIFMASHGRRGLDALLLGSETHKVLTHCKVPVLVYR